MASLGLGDIGRFPFVEPPDKRNMQAGVQLLEELGAVTTGIVPRSADRGDSDHNVRDYPDGPEAPRSPRSAGGSRGCRSTRGWPG